MSLALHFLRSVCTAWSSIIDVKRRKPNNTAATMSAKDESKNEEHEHR
jgi:hypothetical protein